MTNAEKFIKIFNMNPAYSQCPCFCPSCPNWGTDRYDKCSSGDWWQMEYQEPKTESEDHDGQTND